MRGIELKYEPARGLQPGEEKAKGPSQYITRAPIVLQALSGHAHPPYRQPSRIYAGMNKSKLCSKPLHLHLLVSNVKTS